MSEAVSFRYSVHCVPPFRMTKFRTHTQNARGNEGSCGISVSLQPREQIRGRGVPKAFDMRFPQARIQVLKPISSLKAYDQYCIMSAALFALTFYTTREEARINIASCHLYQLLSPLTRGTEHRGRTRPQRNRGRTVLRVLQRS